VLRLTGLSLHFWQPDRPKEHIRALIEDYVEDLRHLPADILDETVRIWRRTGEWFPKVAQLLAIADPLLAKRRKELHKLERVAGFLDAKPAPAPAPRTEKDKERASHLVREATAAQQTTGLTPSPRSRRSIDRSQPPSEAEAAQYRQLYNRRMKQMRRDGLLDDELDEENQK